MSDISDEIMEKAEVILSNFIDSWGDDKLLVARALMAERKKALEEAAKVADRSTGGGCACEGYGCTCGNYDDAGSAGGAAAAKHIAAAIRNLGEG